MEGPDTAALDAAAAAVRRHTGRDDLGDALAVLVRTSRWDIGVLLHPHDVRLSLVIEPPPRTMSQESSRVKREEGTR